MQSVLGTIVAAPANEARCKEALATVMLPQAAALDPADPYALLHRWGAFRTTISPAGTFEIAPDEALTFDAVWSGGAQRTPCTVPTSWVVVSTNISVTFDPQLQKYASPPTVDATVMQQAIGGLVRLNLGGVNPYPFDFSLPWYVTDVAQPLSARRLAQVAGVPDAQAVRMASGPADASDADRNRLAVAIGFSGAADTDRPARWGLLVDRHRSVLSESALLFAAGSPPAAASPSEAWASAIGFVSLRAWDPFRVIASPCTTSPDPRANCSSIFTMAVGDAFDATLGQGKPLRVHVLWQAQRSDPLRDTAAIIAPDGTLTDVTTTSFVDLSALGLPSVATMRGL